MAAAVAGGGEGTTVWLFFKRMFSSVPMDTYIAMVVLAAFDWKLPAVAVSFADMVGAANPFLAMLMLGIGFELQLKKRRCSENLEDAFHSLRHGGVPCVCLLALGAFCGGNPSCARHPHVGARFGDLHDL